MAVVTGASVGLTVGGLATDGDIPTYLGLEMVRAGGAGLIFSGAIVHAAHGESKRAWASVGLRTLGAVVGVGLGPVFTPNTLEGTLDGMGYGGIVGIGTVLLLETVLMTDQKTVRRSSGAEGLDT